MTGADGTYDYKAMAAGIVLAGGEGMGNLLPVVEKELLHYRILDAMMREGFFSSLVFQGGTSLRLCHGSPRYSEDLDFGSVKPTLTYERGALIREEVQTFSLWPLLLNGYRYSKARGVHVQHQCSGCGS